MNKSLLRAAWSLALVTGMILFAGIACDPGEPSESERKVVDAPIESIDVLVRESFPPGYTAHITSGLPSGCAKFNEAKITGRTADTITINVTNTIPADPNAICTAIYGYKETNLDLGQDFKSGQTYTVKANDKSKTFIAQ